MANKLYEETDISAIATAIREKNGADDTYTVADMAPAIRAIPTGGGGGGGLTVKTVTTTENTISTGLSSVKMLYLYRETIASVGLVSILYRDDKSTTPRSTCSSYSQYLTAVSASAAGTFAAVDGGVFEYTGGGTNATDLASGVTYFWYAVGEA